VELAFQGVAVIGGSREDGCKEGLAIERGAGDSVADGIAGVDSEDLVGTLRDAHRIVDDAYDSELLTVIFLRTRKAAGELVQPKQLVLSRRTLEILANAALAVGLRSTVAR